VISGVQVLLPGLFDLPLDELDPGLLREQLPNLNFILGRSTTRANEDYSIDALLASALLPQAGDGGAGLAMASAFADDDQVSERLMLVKAIHLRADMQGAIAIPIPEDPQNIHDIDIIINDLRDYFKVDCYIASVADGLYLLRLRHFDPPTHYPHSLSVLGKNVNPFIEQSRQVMPWYRLINEFQMFMHQHPLNAQRLQQGRLPINSLWAWGAGAAPVPTARPLFYCDDPLLRRFAASLGMQLESCGNLQGDADLGAALVVDLRLLQLLKAGSAARLDELLLEIENHLLRPLLQALQRRPAPLLLRAAYRLDFALGARARFKFWRRPATLLDWR
jgi:hypothetical protein